VIADRGAVPGGGAERVARTSFREVFAVAEFRALWVAQLLSVAGDQLARLALTVLVYDRTGSALLAAVTFVASIVSAFIGGVTLAWLADRYPRRTVMIVSNLLQAALVAVMTIPGIPLAVLVLLLFAVTLADAPFSAARAAIVPDILTGDRYVVGTAVTVTTYQFAQVIGFAAGGAVVGFLGTRRSLLADAVTFAVSALIIGAWVRVGRVRAAQAGQGSSRAAGIAAAARMVLTRPALRTPLLLGLLASFYNAPEGVAAPLAHALGGGDATAGVILAANSLGQSAGAVIFSRLVAPPARGRLMAPMAISACAVLIVFGWKPGIVISLLVLVASGACAAYQLAASAAFVTAAPQEQRSQVFGLAQGAMSLGQGLIMILAGALAGQHAPARAVAVCGAAGALAGLAVAVSATRRRLHGRRQRARG